MGAQLHDPSARVDLHSHARPDQARVKHVELDLVVDFAVKRLAGKTTLTFERPKSATQDAPLILDVRGLDILGVRTKDGAECRHKVGTADPILGSALSIEVPAGKDQVVIDYRTSERSTALQWLEPRGTTGGKSPFLFTQSEAIHARSWIPLQDSPAVKVTHEATIRVPGTLTALMSADRVAPETGAGAGVFRFRMDQPVAPYLIALAVGDLAFRPLGERTGVWAEPGVVESAAREFADTERMVQAAEARYGPYRWGRYDILVLPPSFPFGGMENPKLTFATPTILAGDRSLVALVAHELAHSWSGNLATNATWRDFWLNEGFTTYLEQRIIEDLYGAGRADMERILGVRTLMEQLANLPPRDQVLHIDLAGRDPDDGMTQVAYEKGSLFLTRVERAFGRPRFDAYLRGYFDRFAFKSLTTGEFVDDLRRYLFALDPKAAEAVDLASWLERPGLPADTPNFSSTRLAAVDEAAQGWATGTLPVDRIDTREWTTHEWLHFLGALPAPISVERMAELDKAFGLTARGNAEILAKWLALAITNGYAPADEPLERFLTGVGRRKFLIPLYGELAKTPKGRERARAIFAKARPFYHPIAVDSVERLLATPGH